MHLQTALETCQQGRAVDEDQLNWLLADADFALRSLDQTGPQQNPAQRAKLVELLLCLANIQEYLRHHSVVLKPAD